MRQYSKVSHCLWASKRFAPHNDQCKCLYVYCLTSPHGNSIGCYRLPIGYIMADLQWARDKAIEALDEVSQSGLIDLFIDEELVRIDLFLAHNPVTNQKHAEGASKLALALPDCNLKTTVIKELLTQKNLPSNATIKGLERAIAPRPKPKPDRDPNKTENKTETDLPELDWASPPEPASASSALVPASEQDELVAALERIERLRAGGVND